MGKVLIVGAGFYGATMAHELHGAGHQVTVLERRDHVAGNAFTRWNEEAQCHEHVYGAHIFHTSNKAVWDYVNQFAPFNGYRHRVKVQIRRAVYSFPINLMTLHQVFSVMTPEQGRAAIAKDCEPCAEPANMEQHCLATIGRRLYRMFIEGYTSKQWGKHPRDLPASIVKRIPVRLTYNDDYFEDQYQGIPERGYTQLVRRMLDGIDVRLGVDFNDDAQRWISDNDLVVNTGSIDEFFKYSKGRLGYRSLRFARVVRNCADSQGCAVVNYPLLHEPWTRVIEHHHFDTGRKGSRTLLTSEFPQAEGEPFYPINTPENAALLETYRAMAKEHFPSVVFGGRLGEYRYLDMHQVIACALAKARELGERLR